MKTSKIVEAMGYIDDDLITASIDYKPRKIKMKWIPYAAAACAACFCILAVRISNDNGSVNAGNTMSEALSHDFGTGDISTGNGELNAEGTTSGEITGNASSGISTTGTAPVDKPGNPTSASGENSGSNKPGDPTTSYGEMPGTGDPEKNPSNSFGDNSGSGKPAYDEVFKGFGGTFATGSSMSYDEIADILTNDPKYPEWDTDSLYLVETIKALSLDECRALTGWKGTYSDRAMYKVRVQKDLISGETVDRVENVFISMGTAARQTKGDPTYAPGEKFTVVLTKPYEGCDFLRTPAAFAFRYDAVEENGEIMLYSRRSGLDALNMPTSVNIEESVVTSTTKNPAIYSQKLTLTAFADYLREDFKKRGLTSHFDNAPSNDPSENGQDGQNTRQAAPVEEKPPVGSSPNAYLSTKPVTFSTAKEQVRFTEVKEVSGADFVGYELDYVMPSETLIALRYVYSDGEVSVRDNSDDSGVIFCPEWYEKIERDGMVFWKPLIFDTPTVIYISESVEYFASFESDADLSKAIDTIKSLV